MLLTLLTQKKRSKKLKRKFATFILTHGRADNVLSYHALKKGGYTGQIYLLVDDEDKQLDAYLEKYGDEVIVFDKKKVAKSVDACDNYGKRNSVVFARNYNFTIARELGLTHFWQLDDDYPQFGWAMNNNGDYITSNVVTRRLDPIIDACLDFLDDSGATSVAFAQGGDFIGGGDGRFAKLAKQGKFSRKAMNSFFFRADADVTFRGRVNDDVNLYVECGRRGELFVTIPRLRLWQPQTQAEAGGCTDIYLEMGTYIKSFYSVLVAPSCVKIAAMGGKHRRIHHMVQWNRACPVILDEKYRKPRVD
jgi:hypothetical protein